MNNIIKLRIFLWLALAGIVGWLLYMGIVPGGKISYVYDFRKPDYFIGRLTPEERVELPKEGSQKIIGDPVYFTLRMPRKFNKAQLTLKYRHGRQNTDISSYEIPIIEAGILVDKTIWRYDLKPLENRIIDRLSLAWYVIAENGIVLLQREKKFNSIKDFLNNAPDRNEIALYHYDLDTEFLIPDYKPSDKENNITHALRGPYQFYTYIKDEALDIVFTFIDVNKNKDSDPIDINFYYQEQLIDTRHLDDDGVANDSGRMSELRSLELNVPNLPEGIYKIELRANDDIVTKQISTKQKKMSFVNKLWVADGDNENITMFTDSNLVNAKTTNPAKLQIIKAGDRELKIEETYKQFSAKIAGTSTEIILARDDVILSGNGVFSFSRESLINPHFKKVDVLLDVNRDSINYVLAQYRKPEEENGWKIASVEFNLDDAYCEKGQYSFLFSIPGLKVDDEIGDYIEAREIRVDLEGKSLIEKLFGNKQK